MAALPQTVLPPGIRSRFVKNVNGLRTHILEAGFETGSEKKDARPLVLLLHGFPELAYSWRKVMLPLAAAGYRVVAPDQRGYGRTTGWDGNYDGDVASFRTLNLVRDVMALVFALGHRSVAGVFGHDAGSYVAAWSALIRPDIFRSAAMMSGPFAGAPALPFGTHDEGSTKNDGSPTPGAAHIHDDLAALKRSRKHYQWYYSTRPANDNMWKCPQGVHAFMRAYYHHKSADWKQNQPFPLKSWTATELEKMPTYYIMDLNEGMAETVAKEMPTSAEIAANTWL
ncbi:MAG: alpha/beta fold hydrolase, partial [Betaproteobacteria bacterium]